MILPAPILSVLWIMEYYYPPYNVSRSTMSGIAEYRSALTLDWLAAEDSRQRELVAAFETEATPPARVFTTDCIAYGRPASGKVARLMLELLKNLEGDEGTIITDLIQVLIRTKMLVETSMLESEPDLDMLVKTPGVMMGEPHTTFPRILAMTWMMVTDPTTTKRHGWCLINKVNKYLTITKSTHIANHMRSLEPIVARARFIMEEFIQHVTPLNIYQKEYDKKKISSNRNLKFEQQKGSLITNQALHLARAYTAVTQSMESQKLSDIIDGNDIFDSNACDLPQIYKCPSLCGDFNFDSNFPEDHWMFRNTKQPDVADLPCLKVRPSARDIVKRFYAILPYFDRDHANTVFLHKFRGTVYSMSEGEDILDREAAFYATVLTPIVFMQQYRDTWCLLERFHRAIRLFQISHPTEKRSALKLLQNLRSVNQKIASFVSDLPGPTAATRTTSLPDSEDDEIHDKKDIRYLKELIKNLG